MRRILGLAAIVGASLFAVPAVAAADNLPVQVGGEVTGKPWIDLQGIYPKKPVVHVGDTIDFSIVGFHTIAVLPNGDDVPAADRPDRREVPGHATTPPATRSGGATSSTRSASTGPSSRRHGDDVRRHGARALGRPGTGLGDVHDAPASYELACEIHPFMRGTVKVVDAGAKVRPFAKQVKKGAKQLRKDREGGEEARQEAGPQQASRRQRSTVASTATATTTRPRRPSSAPVRAPSASRCCGSTRPTPRSRPAAP